MQWLIDLLVAAVCGAAVGLEREVRRKPAGLRTNMLIALGAALFTQASLLIDASRGDPARIAAQVVVGVGFLGAGAILHHRHDTITGLTSAATVWVVAALGLLAGAQHEWMALFGTALTLGILSIIDQLERQLDEKYERHHLRVEIRAGEGVGNAVRRELRRLRVHVEAMNLTPLPERRASVRVSYAASPAARERLLGRLGRLEGVQHVEDESE